MKTNINKSFLIFLSQRKLTTSGSPLILFVNARSFNCIQNWITCGLPVFPFPSNNNAIEGNMLVPQPQLLVIAFDFTRKP